MQSDWLNSTLSPVIYEDITLSIKNKHTNLPQSKILKTNQQLVYHWQHVLLHFQDWTKINKVRTILPEVRMGINFCIQILRYVPSSKE